LSRNVAKKKTIISIGESARSMLGQHRDDDIARVQQDEFLFVRRDLDEAKFSDQENSLLNDHHNQ
jgi:hypothetical protein